MKSLPVNGDCLAQLLILYLTRVKGISIELPTGEEEESLIYFNIKGRIVFKNVNGTIDAHVENISN